MAEVSTSSTALTPPPGLQPPRDLRGLPPPDPTAQARQSFDVATGTGSPGLGRRPVGALEQLGADWRLAAGPQIGMRTWASGNYKDPSYNKWAGIEGYEDYAEDLLEADSREERDAIVALIHANLRDQQTSAQGPLWSWFSNLLAGVADPLNLIPVPAVRGLGFVRGATRAGGANLAIGTGAEIARQWADPTARPEEALFNISLSGIIGAGLGGVSGAIGSRRHSAGVRNLDMALGQVDSPDVALDLRGYDIGMDIVEGRTKRRADGSRDWVDIETVQDGWMAKEVGGVRYHSEDGVNWMLYDDIASDTPRPIDPEILNELGRAEPVLKRRMTVDDMASNKHFADGKWHDEIQSYMPEGDRSPVEAVIRSGKDLSRFRARHALWKDQNPQKPGETTADFNQRTGMQALQEMRASRAEGKYSAPSEFISWMLGWSNFSPFGNAMRASGNDAYIADTFARVIGDSGFALKGNDFGHAMPPSIYLMGQNHMVNFRKVEAKILQEWVRFVEGSRTSTGKEFMRQNLTASFYRMQRGARKKIGSQEMGFDDFAEMSVMAVIHSGDFSHNGFPVNQNARNAAKEITLLLQDYDAGMRGAGMFKDQKQLKAEIASWTSHARALKRSLTRFVWGEGGEPKNYRHAVRVKGEPEQFIDLKAFNELEGADADNAHGWAAIKWRGKVYQEGDEHADVLANLLRQHPEAKADIEADPESAFGFVYGGVSEQVFSGETDEEAIDALIAAWGEGGVLAAERLRPEDFGWSPRQGDGFINVDDMLAQRVKGLSPAQLKIYKDRRSSLDLAETHIEMATQDLKVATDKPHQFKSANGNPENYWTRYWLRGKAGAEKEKLTWLITQWYRHDGNLTSAESNAATTVDNIVQGKVGNAHDKGSARVLEQRALNIPNSFSAVHPQWGEIKVTDYIDLNPMSVLQNYVHQIGNRIEAARMFGDADFKGEKIRMREHLLQKFFEPAKDDAGRARAMETIRRIEGEFDLSIDAVYGRLKETDPSAWHNETGRLIQQVTQLTTMGKAVLNSTMDVGHMGMVHGMKTQFNALLTRFLGDIDKVGPELRQHGEYIDLLEMATSYMNVQEHAMENGRPNVNGNIIGKWIGDRIPGYYKINGLTPATVFLKGINTFAAGHDVMRDAIRIAEIVNAGGIPSKADILRLAALGINARDAVLIARQPFERGINGLILPGVDRWEGLEGMQARQKFMQAIHADMRRSVSTPGLADSNLIFRGVWTWGGQKTGFESEMLKIPLQFMSYGMGAWNKIIASGLQGRDRAPVMGIFYMVMAGMMSDYLRVDYQTWQRRTLDQHISNAIETSGITGFWLGDLNRMVERISNNRYGARPLLGIDPSGAKKTDAEAIASMLGAGPTRAWDIAKTFYDPQAGASEIAAAIRKATIYGNVLWWENPFRAITGELASNFEGNRR